MWRNETDALQNLDTRMQLDYVLFNIYTFNSYKFLKNFSNDSIYVELNL